MNDRPRTDAHSLPDIEQVGAGRGQAAHPGSAGQQEMQRINSGLTGDKVAHTDISAVSLPTDDEAGGGAPGAAMTPQPPAPANNAARDPNRSNERVPPAPWIWVVLAVVAAVALGWLLLSALA